MGKLLVDSLFKDYYFFRKAVLIILILGSISHINKGQIVHPDLGLHGQVTWLSDTKIRVEYDWSDDSQLLDWTPTNGSSLLRNSGTVSIVGGVASVRSMIWKQLIKCSRISAQDAKAVNSSRAHLNFITNVSGWTGYDFNPEEMIGVIYISDGNLWVENGTHSSLPSPSIIIGNSYNIEFVISETSVSTKSSSDNNVYSYNLISPPDPDRQVAIGGWGGDTDWGTLIIEGDIDTSWQPRDDMIEIISGGAFFSPVIEVTGNPLIEWIFDDGTISSSTSPVKNYGSIGGRHNLLRVTPWSALVGINAGYDAADGGYGGFAMVGNQDILGFRNLSLASNNLKYICASYSPLAELDLTGFSSLEFIELVYCYNLSSLKLGTHPYLERICVEDCNLVSLDIAGCPSIADLRGANNRYTSIEWGTVGVNLWHICLRSNPQFTENLPNLTQFPSLEELLIWDSNQNGIIECHSSSIRSIDAYDNYYSGANLAGCDNLNSLSLSGNHNLTSLNLGLLGSLTIVSFKDCYMAETLTDYVLQTLDESGRANGNLDLTGNAVPSTSGMNHYNNLKNKGWNVYIAEPGQIVQIGIISISSSGGATIIDFDKGSLQLNAEILPAYATDKSITWTIIDGMDLATVDENGLINALKNGTITVRATANDGSGIYGEIDITIINQKNPGNNNYPSIERIILDGNILKIILDHDYYSWRARVFNLDGKIIFQKNIESYLLEFDISSLVPGLYLIVLSKGQQIVSGEFIKP